MRFFKDFKRFFNYVVFAAKAEINSEVADSFLSWLWWFLDPLLYMLVYSFVTVIIFQNDTPAFPVFVFIALNTWTFFSKTVKSSVKLVAAKKNIVTKVYVPKHMFVFEKIGVYGFKMVVANLLVVITMIGYKIPFTWRLLWIIPITIVLILVTFGISTIIMHFGVFVEDLLNVVTVVLQLGFYLSGIFYSFECLKVLGATVESKIQKNYPEVSALLLKLNPMALIIDDLRRIIMCNADPHWVMLLIWAGVGLLASWVGVSIIYKSENSYVKVI